MCEYCNLLSGDYKRLDEYTNIVMTRHNNYYTIESEECEVNINYCPMCGRKLV